MSYFRFQSLCVSVSVVQFDALELFLLSNSQLASKVSGGIENDGTVNLQLQVCMCILFNVDFKVVFTMLSATILCYLCKK